MPAPAPSALIDRVDTANNTIGVVPRADVFEAGANFRTVHVLLTNSDGLLLVQQIASNRDRHPGLWGSSVAGYLYAGETYEAAAARRLREELDVTAELVLCGVVSMADAGVIKFVGVFTGGADHPRNAEPDHVAAIEFRRVDQIATDLADGLSTYTDTFAQVFRYWTEHPTSI